MHSVNVAVLENYLVNTPFDAISFLDQVRAHLPNIDTDDHWIRSGSRITAKYKDRLSSYRLLGSYSPADGRARVEVLLIKPTPLSPIGVTEAPALDFIKEYQTENRVDAVFAALLSTMDEKWRFFLTANISRGGFSLPDDLLSYAAANTLKKYLKTRCALSDAALDGFFSNGYVLFDDSVIRNKAKRIDDALAAIEVCDVAAGNGSLLTIMGEKIASIRCDLSKYLNVDPKRTQENFLAHFALNSLYATDLDAGAIELLKLLAAKIFGEHALDGRIVYGSVLTEDIFGGKEFDVVISNPPHMRHEEFSAIKQSFSRYKVFHKNADLYCYYAERAVAMLKKGGCAGIITSNRWMRSEYGAPLRAFLSDCNVTDVLDYGNIPLTKEIVTPMSVVTVVNNEKTDDKIRVTTVGERNHGNITEVVENQFSLYARKNLDEGPWTFEADNSMAIMQKIAEIGIPLEKYVQGKVYRGILTGLNEAFTVSATEADDFIRRDPKSKDLLRPFAGGRDIKRYAKPAVKKYLIFVPKGLTNKTRGDAKPWEWFSQNYPVIAKHLKKFEQQAMKRRDKGDYWWELRSCRYYVVFDEDKIISPTIINRISATMDDSGLYTNDKTSVIAAADYYLLGLLNSRLMDFYARRITTSLLNDYYELKPANLAALPIKRISETNGFQRKLRDEIAENAKKLSVLAASENNDVEQSLAAERAVNKAVYKLYKLTAQEINQVENN